MLTRKLEDYLESVHKLVEEKGYARIKDVAEDRNVSSPSVTEIIKKLESKKLVRYERYGAITLTPEGERLGKLVRNRHKMLMKLLEILQIPGKIADDDACTMEHELNPVTLEQIQKFVDFVEKSPMINPKWLEHFKIYSETGEFPLCRQA